MDGHHIHLVEGSGATRAFAHAIADAVIDTLVAKQMATCFQCRVLEVVSAYRAQRKRLMPVSFQERM